MLHRRHGTICGIHPGEHKIVSVCRELLVFHLACGDVLSRKIKHSFYFEWLGCTDAPITPGDQRGSRFVFGRVFVGSGLFGFDILDHSFCKVFVGVRRLGDRPMVAAVPWWDL